MTARVLTVQAKLYDCDGECVNDENGNGICDELESLGCTYDRSMQFQSNGNRG